MKNLSFLILLIAIFVTELSSQNLYNTQWVIGYDTSLLDNIGLNILLDFREEELRISNINTISGFEMEGSNTSICNTYGDLLFYSNGCSILNANHEIMENGSELSIGIINDFFCPTGSNPIPQGIVSIPAPCSDSLYYLFNTDLQNNVYQSPNTSLAPLNLVYHIIDISKNNGLGEVVVKNQTIIQDTLGRGSITASLHENGCDWWIIIPKSHSNCYYLLLVTKDGIQPPKLECEGHTWNDSDGGSATLSPDGRKYARFNYQNGLNIMDFDNEIGAFSNSVNIQFLNDTFPTNTGISISPNSQFIYTSAREKLYQFDLKSQNIESSKILVAEWDGFFDPSPTIFNFSALAPNGKIYIASTSTHKSLHVIHEPNNKGIDCMIDQHAIELPSWNFISIPNIPNFANYVKCDSIVSNAEVENFNIKIFPNPASNKLHIKLDQGSLQGIQIYTVLGERIHQQQLNSNKATLSVREWTDGIYLLEVQTQSGQRYWRKVMVQ